MYNVNAVLHYRSYPIAIFSNTNNDSIVIIVVFEIVIATIIQMSIFLLSFVFYPFVINNISIKRIAIKIYMSMRAFFSEFDVRKWLLENEEDLVCKSVK